MKEGLSVPRLNSAEQFSEMIVNEWYEEGILELKTVQQSWGIEVTIITNKGNRVLKVKKPKHISKLLAFIEELRACGLVETDYDLVKLRKTH